MTVEWETEKPEPKPEPTRLTFGSQLNGLTIRVHPPTDNGAFCSLSLSVCEHREGSMEENQRTFPRYAIGAVRKMLGEFEATL